MKTYSLFIFILIIIMYSCINETDKRTDQEIEVLIIGHSNNLLLMSFWSGMNQRDFERVKILESNKGKLKQGKFILIQPNSVETEFEVLNDGKSIKLKYEDNYTEEYKDLNCGPQNDGSNKVVAYVYLKNYLIESLDEKYERIDSNYNYIVWRTKDKVILFNASINYYDSYMSSAALIKEVFPSDTPKSDLFKHIYYEGAQQYCSFNSDEKVWYLAKCLLTLEYKMYTDYLDEIGEKKRLEHKEMQKTIRDSIIEGNQIQKSKENL